MIYFFMLSISYMIEMFCQKVYLMSIWQDTMHDIKLWQTITQRIFIAHLVINDEREWIFKAAHFVRFLFPSQWARKWEWGKWEKTIFLTSMKISVWFYSHLTVTFVYFHFKAYIEKKRGKTHGFSCS